MPNNSSYLILVNPNNPLTEELPFNIVTYHSECPLNHHPNIEQETYKYWCQYRDFLRSNGIYADSSSGYRSISDQAQIYEEIEKEKGPAYAKQYVALPGTSEHHTGLAIDIAIKVGDTWYEDYEESLAGAYAFIAQTCARYGFIIRFPKGKEDITGYNYEPWHIRYVGSRSIAEEIMQNNETLEEYLTPQFTFTKVAPK